MTTFRKYFVFAATAAALSLAPFALTSASAHGGFHPGGGGHGGFGGSMGGGYGHGYGGHYEHGGHDYGRYGYYHGYCRWNYCGGGYDYEGASAEGPVCPEGYHFGEDSRCWPN